MKRRQFLLGAAALLAGAVLVAAGYRLRLAQPEEVMSSSTSRPIYLVQQLRYRSTSRGYHYLQDEGRPGNIVKAFADRSQAEAHCRELNFQKRSENPFCYLPFSFDSYPFLDRYTSMGHAAFLAFIESEGLTPPTRDYSKHYDMYEEPWVDWWEAQKPWGEQRLERMWAALDKVRFYEVVEVTLEP
jgi:hypothetical protein